MEWSLVNFSVDGCDFGRIFVIRSLRRNNLVLESEALGVKPNMDYQLFQEMKGNCRLELRVQIKK